uniref:DUF19 domain-containing protein n=1 Tax=Tetranychus urticae TaxID=32264 RepID=T1K3A2_TETUR
MFGLILFISFLSYSTESQQNFVQQSSWMFNQRQIEKNQQPCHFKMIEKCFKRFEKYSNRRYSVGVLSEKEGLDDLCNTTQSTFNCLTDSVNQCGTPFHRELAKNIIKELSKTFKKFCEPGKLRDGNAITSCSDHSIILFFEYYLYLEFSKHAPCIIDEVLNTVNYKQDCYFPFLTSIGRTFTVKTIDHHLEVACCAYNKWQSCLFK